MQTKLEAKTELFFFPLTTIANNNAYVKMLKMKDLGVKIVSFS